MSRIDWALTAKGLIYTILACVALFLYLAFVVWVGRKLHEADLRQQEEVRINQEGCLRLAILATIADEVELMPDSPERRRLYREADALGFLDSDDLPRLAS